MKGFIEEFKAFAVKGNVIDLAVAVVIGAAFGKIVASLVENIIMPTVGILIGGVSFEGLSYVFGNSEITYGVFLQSVVDFLIIALVIFMVVKALNKTKKPEPVVEPKPVETPEDIRLLREIRDSLRK